MLGVEHAHQTLGTKSFTIPAFLSLWPNFKQRAYINWSFSFSHLPCPLSRLAAASSPLPLQGFFAHSQESLLQILANVSINIQ